MAPIFDSDLENQRFEKEQWRNFELWERIAARQKVRRRQWIFAAVFVFFLLSIVPVWIDRSPKWQSLEVSRDVAQLVNRLKTDSLKNKRGFHLKLLAGLGYEIREVINCDDRTGTLVESGMLSAKTGQVALLDQAAAATLGLEGMLSEFCFDSVSGPEASQALREGKSLAFGFIPANDLTKKRLDRISLTFIRGQAASLAFK